MTEYRISEKGTVVKHAHFVLLCPEEIAECWPRLREALAESGAFPRSVAMDEKALALLQSQQIHCWAVVTLGSDGAALAAFLHTQKLHDSLMGKTKLVIGGLRGYASLHEQVYAEGLKVLEQFGKENGCDYLEAVTEVPHIKQMLDGAGWSKAILLTKEVI